MKIRAIALNTFASLVRNKAIIIFCAVFLCVLALVQGVTRTLSVTASDRNVLTMRVGAQAEMVNGQTNPRA